MQMRRLIGLFTGGRWVKLKKNNKTGRLSPKSTIAFSILSVGVNSEKKILSTVDGYVIRASDMN